MTDSKAVVNARSNLLADRLEQGAKALVAFAEGLSDTEWETKISGDGRTVGVVIHHVASVYPVEVELAQTLASGKSIEGVTMDAIDQMNADHARKNAAVGKRTTLDLLKSNSKAASKTIRELTNEELDSAAEVSLYANAPLTAQFFIEDHALRHSYHHLASMRATLKR